MATSAPSQPPELPAQRERDRLERAWDRLKLFHPGEYGRWYYGPHRDQMAKVLASYDFDDAWTEYFDAALEYLRVRAIEGGTLSHEERTWVRLQLIERLGHLATDIEAVHTNLLDRHASRIFLGTSDFLAGDPDRSAQRLEALEAGLDTMLKAGEAVPEFFLVAASTAIAAKSLRAAELVPKVEALMGTFAGTSFSGAPIEVHLQWLLRAPRAIPLVCKERWQAIRTTADRLEAMEDRGQLVDYLVEYWLHALSTLADCGALAQDSASFMAIDRTLARVIARPGGAITEETRARLRLLASRWFSEELMPASSKLRRVEAAFWGRLGFRPRVFFSE